MSPTRIAALGAELLPLAREYTNDLNEARFLVHRVVLVLVVARPGENEKISLNYVQALMRDAAEQDGIAGRTQY